jgi:hypothetical protein
MGMRGAAGRASLYLLKAPYRVTDLPDHPSDFGSVDSR